MHHQNNVDARVIRTVSKLHCAAWSPTADEKPYQITTSRVDDSFLAAAIMHVPTWIRPAATIPFYSEIWQLNMLALAMLNHSARVSITKTSSDLESDLILSRSKYDVLFVLLLMTSRIENMHTRS